jgi:hypothetical protein
MVDAVASLAWMTGGLAALALSAERQAAALGVAPLSRIAWRLAGSAGCALAVPTALGTWGLGVGWVSVFGLATLVGCLVALVVLPWRPRVLPTIAAASLAAGAALTGWSWIAPGATH